MLPSRAPGGVLSKGGSWLICTLPLNGHRNLLSPLIDNKRREPKMTLRQGALVKRVAELCDAGLRACHYAEEFTLRRIHPLGH
jgi:hypothetical protein